MEWLVGLSILDWLLGIGITLAVLLVFAIFRCIGKAACAKKLGLNCGWMAFMPFLNAYLDGRLAEASDVQLYPLSEKRNKWGKRNLVLRILCVIFSFLFVIGLCVFAVTLVLAFAHKLSNLKINGIVGLISTIVGFVTNAAAYFQDMNTPTVVTEFRVIYIISGTLMVASLVVFLIALIRHFRLMYKTYSALSPRKAGGLLVLSFFIPPSMSIIYMALGFSRKKGEQRPRREKKRRRVGKGKKKDEAEENSVIVLPPPAEEHDAAPAAEPETTNE